MICTTKREREKKIQENKETWTEHIAPHKRQLQGQGLAKSVESPTELDTMKNSDNNNGSKNVWRREEDSAMKKISMVAMVNNMDIYVNTIHTSPRSHNITIITYSSTNHSITVADINIHM